MSRVDFPFAEWRNEPRADEAEMSSVIPTGSQALLPFRKSAGDFEQNS